MQNTNREEDDKLIFADDQQSKALEQPTPNDPPWNNRHAFLLWFASVLFIVVIPNVFVGLYIARAGVNLTDRQALTDFLKSDPAANILAIAAIIPAHVLTLLLTWAIVTKFNKYSFRQTLGWRFDSFKIWYIFVIVGLFLGLAAILSTIFGEQDNELLRILSTSRTAVYLVAFLATFTAPLIEEVVYRGVLYSALQRSVGVIYSVVIVTVLFALIHVPQYYPDFVSITLICLLSLVLTLVRVRTKNLLPCIALHFVFNGIQSLMLILQPFLFNNPDAIHKKAATMIYFLN